MRCVFAVRPRLLVPLRAVLQAALWAGALGAGMRPACAQVTSLAAPFVGYHSETWESFPNYADNGFTPLSSPTRILDGTTLISNPGLTIYEPFASDASLGLSGFAQTSDGAKGLQIGSEQPVTTLVFFNPVQQFGAFWGAETLGGPTTIQVEFYDASHVLLDTKQFTYDHEAQADGELDWHGWSSQTPIVFMTLTGNEITLDGLQATPVPEPGGLAFAASLTAGGAGWFLRRRNRLSRACSCRA